MEKNLAGSFFKRLEIHPAFQTSCPWDLCETCTCVLECSVSTAPVGVARVMWVFFLEMLYRVGCLLHESVANLYSRCIFTEMPHKILYLRPAWSHFHFLSAELAHLCH